jgi:LuxR family maltose regulon positive regulatory protein
MWNQFLHHDTPLVPDDQVFLGRPQLYRLLEQAVQCPLVTVVAGTGYGKTHTVYTFLRTYQAIVTWMQFSERDNNEWRFWENFIQAVGLINRESADKLAKNGFPETKRQFDRYVVIPQEDIAPDLKYVFVYDDFHLLRKKPVLRFLERSFAVPFPNVSSILISRNEPAINTVGFFAKGLLAKLTEDDLRFSEEEMDRYFRLQNIHLPREAASGLYRDTEGWAFAIRLAGLSLKKEAGGGDYGRSSMRSNIFKLIEEEIFSTVSRDLRKYLVKLSLVEPLSLELAAELAGTGGSGKNLAEEMKKIGAFIRFDTYLNAYRIHHLLLEYLTGKQDELTGEEKRDVYTRAGRWCSKNRQKIDAMNYYEKAGAYDLLIEEVYTLSLALPDHVNVYLLDILDRAPEEMYRKNAAARTLHTRLLTTIGKTEEAAAEAGALIKKFEPLPRNAFNSHVLCGAYINLGFLSLLICVHTRRYDFPAYFEKAHGYYLQSDYRISGAVTSATLGPYVCRVGGGEKGEIEKYIEAITATIPHLTAAMNGCAYGQDDLARCEFAYFRGDLADTEKFAYQALYKAQKQNQYEIETRSLFYLLCLNTAQGNYGKIRELFKLLDAQLEIPEYLNRYIFCSVVSGWFYAHIGRGEKIAPWLKDDFEECELNSFMHGREILVQAKWHMAEKRYAEALAALGSEKNLYGLRAFLFGKITLKVLEAVCRYHTGEKQPALDALEAAYGLAEPNALDMPFIEQGWDMCALAEAAMEDNRPIPRPWLEQIRRNASAYAKKLAVTAGRFGDPPRREAGLSRRERAVLTGLSRGLTREELAEKGGLSVNAVKGLITSLYDKLGAVNRADAVRIATGRGLLKNHKPRGN